MFFAPKLRTSAIEELPFVRKMSALDNTLLPDCGRFFMDSPLHLF